jgi:hypothetical protein
MPLVFCSWGWAEVNLFRNPATMAPITAYRAMFKTPIMEYMMNPSTPITSQSIQNVKRSCGGQRIMDALISTDLKPFIGAV